MKAAILVLSLSMLALPCLALADHDHPQVTMPKEFDTLKKLVGNWEGTYMEKGKEEKSVVAYALTSGDTALEEKLAPGTPHEMVSMYHKEGKGLAMTHYCALGNTPRMKLKKAEGNTLFFEMKGNDGIDSAKEMHMHSVKLTLVDDDNLKQEWTNFDKGKAAGTMVFNFKRKK
jgi:hypothetical protein